MPRRGLGRGLDTLIPTGDETSDGLQQIAVDAIMPNPHQPRTSFEEEDLAGLADSIRQHGVIQPLVVTRTPAGEYQLIAGERRWRAAQMAGLDQVPVLLKDAAPQQMLELALVENVQRADLNPLEEAEAYQHLAEEFELSQAEIARRVGKSRVAITNTLRLLQASKAVRQALLDEVITEGHARALLGLPDAELQDAALQAVIERKLTVRQTEALVQKLKQPAPDPVEAASQHSPEVRELEERFQTSLGTRVRLKNGRKGGRVIIYYYSDEEFQALYRRLTGEDL